jgi:hypothetical protein
MGDELRCSCERNDRIVAHRPQSSTSRGCIQRQSDIRKHAQSQYSPEVPRSVTVSVTHLEIVHASSTCHLNASIHQSPQQWDDDSAERYAGVEMQLHMGTADGTHRQLSTSRGYRSIAHWRRCSL